MAPPSKLPTDAFPLQCLKLALQAQLHVPNKLTSQSGVGPPRLAGDADGSRAHGAAAAASDQTAACIQRTPQLSAAAPRAVRGLFLW